MGGKDLNAGTMDVLILKAISTGRLHGYGIGTWLRRSGGELIGAGEGVVYTALQRLQRKGWVESEWGVTDSGRRARFYALTRDGKRRLETEIARISRYSEVVLAMLREPSA